MAWVVTRFRRCAVVDILGGLRDRGSVAALCQVVDDNPIKSYLESIGREELLVRTANALHWANHQIHQPPVTV